MNTWSQRLSHKKVCAIATYWDTLAVETARQWADVDNSFCRGFMSPDYQTLNAWKFRALKFNALLNGIKFGRNGQSSAKIPKRRILAEIWPFRLYFIPFGINPAPNFTALRVFFLMYWRSFLSKNVSRRRVEISIIQSDSGHFSQCRAIFAFKSRAKLRRLVWD